MRYDYLYRYMGAYGTGGFQRLLSGGFSCENTHYNYAPTYTGPGHAAIYTGTTPSVNGIIANEWYDPEQAAHRYVTGDPRYRTVGAPGKSGQHSPEVLLSTTITDELKLFNNLQSKVVGICLKDRGSILPAGHLADACYWFDDATGHWITSTYYPDSAGLPEWVNAFNSRRLPEQYMSKPWMPSGKMTYSFGRWDQYKSAAYGPFSGKFPHDLPALKKNGYGALRFTPFGNSLTMDLGLAAIAGMQLGADEYPDFLCLSFSATDYISHQFGIHAEETEDAYRRLDADMERLLSFLDGQLGKDNYLVFLTADHGGAETPRHLADLRVPAGVFEESKLEKNLEATLATELGMTGDFIREAANQQIWLNWEALDDLETDPNRVADVVIQYLRQLPGVYDAFTREELMAFPPEYPFVAAYRHGIHPRRSGDILFMLDPGWHPDDALFKTGGTTHGSAYAYDTHVPLVWYGYRLTPGATYNAVSITDIAPTLAALLRIMEPSGSTGRVIEALMQNVR
jgi:predicted AlkP superfamily pyrophosphatase or phosphodiesterase